MITEQSIRQAYIHLRKTNTSIPDETLNFMLHASLEALKKTKQVITPNEATAPEIKSNEALRAFIMQMEVGVKYKMQKDFRYKWIRIERNKSEFSDENGFLWGAEYNYSHTQAVGYIYPLKGNNRVVYFKTEAGCKRNLIKYFGNYFREEAQQEKSFFEKWDEVIKKM
jgi:hypothetical protein